MKTITSIPKVRKLNRKEQEKIQGGDSGCYPLKPCDIGYVFVNCECVPEN